ncbi:TetR-like C-terminal domain-containing protein [Yoonia sp. BS5-3]|uniref:TetR-like C-terminal domain-containing protein n=1 Tax=Yoonia phaeophyticola TaxID=3137369 RepID=A0ABZ2V0K8_9RHOB
MFDDAENYAAAPSLEDGRDIRVLLEEFLLNIFQYVTANGDMMRALIAAAQHDTAFHSSFYAKFVLPRDKMISDLLRLAQTRGEFSPERDAELVSGFIHGAFWYRLLNRKPLDARFARAIVSDVFG